MKTMTIVLMTVLLAATCCQAGELFTEEGYKQVNGVDHFYRIAGEGEPFILLHGGPGMYHDELYPFFLEFAKDHRVIFYDQRGNGRTNLAVVDSTTFTVDLMVEDLEGLRQAFGIEKLNIIGHSWGGLLAMYYATEYPENVKRLITVCSAPVNTEILIECYLNQISRFEPEEWTYLEGLWGSEAYLAGNPETHNEAMRLSEGVLFSDPQFIDPYMDVAAFDERTARNAVVLGDLATEMKLNITVQDGLTRIDCPTLLVAGRQDFIVPESFQLTHELIAGSEVVWIEESGHYPYIEQPDAFFGALRGFIARTE